MGRFIVRRLLQMLFVLWAVSVLTFFIFNVIPNGDPAERMAGKQPREAQIEAIREVFGAGDKCPPISATKSLTGHSLGATGVQEAIYSLLMMNNGFICESANIEELDPAFADMPIVRERVDNASIGHVLSNSFGFGGTNATIVLKRLDA